MSGISLGPQSTKHYHDKHLQCYGSTDVDLTFTTRGFDVLLTKQPALVIPAYCRLGFEKVERICQAYLSGYAHLDSEITTHIDTLSHVLQASP